MTFGDALEALKQGKRIARAGWNGKGMFLFLLPANDGIPTKVIHDPALREVIETELGGDTFDALGSIRMFTADKKILTGWLASQTDMLCEDWEILDAMRDIPVSVEKLQEMKDKMSLTTLHTMLTATQYALDTAQIFDWIRTAHKLSPEYLEALRKEINEVLVPSQDEGAATPTP